MQTDYTNKQDVQRAGSTPCFSIFVGGLANTETNESLRHYFSSFGDIASCEVQVWKNHPQKCRGYAVVVAASRQSFEQILNSTHKIGNRVVECKKLITDPNTLTSHNEDVLKRKVFVSGLSKKINDEEFRDFFAQFGDISMAYVVKHHVDKKSRGFGFICFSDVDAKNKLLALKEVKMNGKVIHCADYLSRNSIKPAHKSEAETIAEHTRGGFLPSCESEKRLQSPPTEIYSQNFSHSNSNSALEQPPSKLRISQILVCSPQFVEDESNLKFNRASKPITYAKFQSRRMYHPDAMPRRLAGRF